MKNIKNIDTFRYRDAKVGDLVTADVVMSAMECMPPATMRSDCAQLGEPYSHRIDDKTGKLRPTFATFRRIKGDFTRGVWAFCGYCFRGESEERGKEPAYCV